MIDLDLALHTSHLTGAATLRPLPETDDDRLPHFINSNLAKVKP
jgi:hypothetical protein